MGMGFIERSLKTSGILLLASLPVGLYYYGLYPTLAFFSGGVWGVLNLLLMARLVVKVLSTEGLKLRAALPLLGLKFPLLYLTGYFLFSVDRFNPVYLLVGSALPIGVIVLKAAGRMLLSIDNSERAAQGAGKC